MHTLHIFGIVAWAALAALVIYCASQLVRALLAGMKAGFQELRRHREEEITLREKELRHRRQEEIVREYWEARRGR